MTPAQRRQSHIATLRHNVAWYEAHQLHTAADLARRILERLEAKP